MPVKRSWRPYLEAKDYIRALGIKNHKKWLEYCKKDRLLNIPSNPSLVYKNKGWVDWNDWLGNNNKIGAPRIYTVNDNYFKKWSSNMAYILGFWFADGCMKRSKKTKIFTITQDKKDKYLLVAMLKEMGSDHILTKNKNCYCFAICSETIYDDIIKLGGKERKSFDVKFPHIPKKLLPDFIRGLWDGDGSVFYSEQKKAYISSYSSASVEFINKLYSTLKENVPNLGGSLTESDGEYSLAFAKKDSFKLGKFMYEKPIEEKLMLKRKYDLFMKTTYLRPIRFLEYNDAQKNAQKEAKKLDICSRREWKKYCIEGKIPHNIPRNPNVVYKNSGWIDWYRWLGHTKRSRKRNWRPYLEAWSFVRELTLQGAREWMKYCKTEEKPKDIPTTPNLVYKNSGWVDWGTWLGTTKNPRNIKL